MNMLKNMKKKLIAKYETLKQEKDEWKEKYCEFVDEEVK